VVTDLPAALSRLVDTRAALNITFGAIEAGTVHNAIPTTAVARGTLRVLDRAVWGEAQKLVERILEATVAPYPQVTYRLDYQRGAPPVVNDEEATAVFATAARSGHRRRGRPRTPPRAWAGRTSPGTWRRSPAPWPASASASPAPTSTSTPPPSTWTSGPSPSGVRILVETAIQALDHYGAAQRPAEAVCAAVPRGQGRGREVTP
jgi:metal-dependent amidase/aminoacylase/carboxypeptidase family protein